MKRSHAVHLTLVASVASLLTSCDQTSTRYCVDANQNVADDRNCEESDPGYRWYYAAGYHSQAIGTHIAGGSRTPPANGYRAISSSNGEESSAASERGGIGAAGEAASAAHGSSGHAGE